MSEYLTYKEACEILHLKSYKGLYYLIKNGLPVIVIGNSKRISANDLKKFMEDHTVTTAPKDQAVITWRLSYNSPTSSPG